MLNAFKNVSSGRLDDVTNNFAFPLMRWFSGNPDNLEACEFINVRFFSLPPRVVFGLLFLTTKKGFMQYPKKSAKEKEDKFYTLMRESVKKLYHWSELEYSKNKQMVEPLFDDTTFVKETALAMGFNAKECKLAGVKIKVKKYEFKEQPRGLSAFM